MYTHTHTHTHTHMRAHTYADIGTDTHWQADRVADLIQPSVAAPYLRREIDGSTIPAAFRANQLATDLCCMCSPC